MEGAHLGCVEEQVSDSSTMDVIVLVGDIGEDDAVGDFLTRPAKSRLLEVRLSRRWEAQKPENRVGNLDEDVEPDAEDEGVDLKRDKGVSSAPTFPGDEPTL